MKTIHLAAALASAALIATACSSDGTATSASSEADAPATSATSTTALTSSTTVKEPALTTSTEPTTSSSAAALDPAANEVGVERESTGIFITVDGIRRTTATEFCQLNDRIDLCEQLDPITADVIFIETTFRNETAEGLDLTCGYVIDHALIDAQQRELESTGGLSRVPENPGCNDSLNPGFSTSIAYTYAIPAGADFTGWRFYNPFGPDDRPGPTIQFNLTDGAQPPIESVDPSEPSDEVATGSGDLGVERESTGIFITVDGIRRTTATEFCQLNDRIDLCEQLDPITADVIFIETTFRNETAEGLDLTCGYVIDHALIDAQQRELESTGGLSRVPENPGCNDSLNPGFSTSIAYTYAIPAGADFTGWRFYNPFGPDDRPGPTIQFNLTE